MRMVAIFVNEQLKATMVLLCMPIIAIGLFLFASLSYAATDFTHGAGGFTVSIPDGWAAEITRNGLELTKKQARISIEQLNISSKKSSSTEILTQLITPTANWQPVASQLQAMTKPYPGTRAAVKNLSGIAELAVIKSPSGYYLVAIEDAGADEKTVFDSLISSFQVTDLTISQYKGIGMQAVDLGGVEVLMPPGKILTERGYALWTSNAQGMLNVELYRHKQNMPYLSFLDNWEKSMLSQETGLKKKVSSISGNIDGKAGIIADYEGDKMKARVMVVSMSPTQTIMIAMVSQHKSYLHHLSVMDAVAFSAELATASKVSITKAESTKAQKKSSVSTKAQTLNSENSPGKNDPPESAGKTSEKSFWDKFKANVKQGADQSNCTAAQRSLNQCR